MSSERKAQVEQLAYKIWEAEGRPHGRDKEHWHRAEHDLAKEEPKAAGASSVEATPDAPAKAKKASAPKAAKPVAAKPAAAKPAAKPGAKPAAKPAKAPKPKA